MPFFRTLAVLGGIAGALTVLVEAVSYGGTNTNVLEATLWIRFGILAVLFASILGVVARFIDIYNQS